MGLPRTRHVYTPLLFFLLLLLAAVPARSQDDAAVLIDLKNSLTNPPASWTGSDPCEWGSGIQCQSTRVTRIQIGSKNLNGTLPATLANLTMLTVLEVMNNNLTGPLPSLSGLANLQTLNLHTNSFTSVPPDFFSGMTSLTSVNLDQNPFSPWTIPKGIVDSTGLREFSANQAKLVGPVPEIFSGKNFPGLQSLHLAMNDLVGGLPGSLAGSSIQSLWLNGQTSGLNGSISVIGNMTSLTEVWLNKNLFTGGLPDFSGLTGLENLTLRDNQLTGPVPASLVSLTSLKMVNLTNNYLQGPIPNFSSGASSDLTIEGNRFCTATPGGQCSDLVNVLLEIAGGFLYPQILASNWLGNDPCRVGDQWKGITCLGSNVTVINFRYLGLAGSISPSFSKIPSLQKILLANNSIGGAIPDSLTGLSSLVELDVSNNNLHGPVPVFQKNVVLNVAGNVDINKNSSSTPPSGSPGTSGGPSSGGGGEGGGGSSSGSAGGGKSSSKAKVVVPVVAVACCVCIVGLGVLYFRRKRTSSGKVQSPSAVVIHPHDSDDGVKITIAESSMTGATGSSSYTTGGSSDIQVVEAGNMVISIQVLREVTNNFSEANILGKGGFGTVYKGELHDGTKIAVKRMESGLVSEKGLTEFRAEIDVLNKVRHRHLVTLHGYCLDGSEKLLVYEYMPQGTLSRYLFHWEEENIKPLAWSRRLIIALDVARGVEYLHGLAQQTFIHRDLKPSNILLDDNMRAKVADFGLVRLAPEGGKASIATRIAGTFGYLAPEYAVTGRVTTKIDVFSFGVILMELISGRKALDESRPEDSLHLVTWFRRKSIEKDSFRDAIDPTIELNEEILASVVKVAELAGHCTAREPYQRPDMGHVVNVLSSLVELWKPTETEDEDIFAAIDYGMTLRQTVKMWKDSENSNSGYSVSSSFVPGSNDNTQTSIPNRPTGFAESFQSADAR